MIIDLIGVQTGSSFPNDCFEVEISTASSLPEICEVAIERPGQDKPYLASGGWQANYNCIRASIIQDGSVVHGLHLPRNLLRFFEPGNNYKISLFDLQGEDLGFFVMSWDLGPEVRPNPTPSRVPDPEPKQISSPELAQLPSTAQILNAAPVSVPDVMPLKLEGPIPTPVAPVGPIIIQCRNRKCRGEIFSTFPACPYCGSSMG
jgi:hypothetical protein